MSLVNYSSDEEDDEEQDEQQEEREKEEKPQQTGVSQRASSSSSSGPLAIASVTSSNSSLASREVAKLPADVRSSTSSLGQASLKLPDASMLFASFGVVKESMSGNIRGGAFTSIKRSDLNGSADGPRKKISKGSLMPSRILPDTAGGSLLPPQLRGRDKGQVFSYLV